MKPGTGGGSSAGPDCGAGCSTLGPCDPAELMALGVSVPFGTFVRPLEVNDRRDLWDFGPSSADSCSLSEKQFFTCSWALVETLTIGHKVTMQAELPIMSWVTSDPSSPNRMCTAEIHYQVEVVPKLAVLKMQKKFPIRNYSNTRGFYSRYSAICSQATLQPHGVCSMVT